MQGANKTLIIPLPALIDGGDRMICLHADNDNSSEEEICRIIVFKEVALEVIFQFQLLHFSAINNNH